MTSKLSIKSISFNFNLISFWFSKKRLVSYKNKSLFFIAGIIDKTVPDQIPKQFLESEAKKSNTKIYYNVQNIKKFLYVIQILSI